MTPGEMQIRLNKMEEDVQLLKKIYDPHSSESPDKWNISGLLNSLKWHATEIDRAFWAEKRSKLPKREYWKQMESKKQDARLAAERGEKKQWDKGAD